LQEIVFGGAIQFLRSGRGWFIADTVLIVFFLCLGRMKQQG